MELFDFQKNEAERILQILTKDRAAVLAWDMGLGKTVVSCWIARQLWKPVLVICPKTLIPGWRKTLDAFAVREYRIFSYEKALRNIDGILGETENETLVIGDEIHRGKSSKSKTGKMLCKFRRCYFLGLSATLCESPLDMKCLGYLLKLYNGNFWDWARGFGCKPAFFGGFEFNGDKKQLGRLHNMVFPSRGSSLSLKDVPQFKDSSIIEESLDFGENDEIQKLYDEMGLELDALDQRIAEYVETPLTSLQAIRQRVELLKVPGTAELANDAAEDGNSVLIFTNYLSTIDSLLKRMLHAQVIKGDQKPSERQSIIDRFQSGELRQIIIQAGAGAEGLSLGDETGERPRVAFIFPSFNARQTRQCMGRPARITNATPATIRFLIAYKTIEERIQKVFNLKTNNMRIFNEGSKEADQCKSNERFRVANGAGTDYVGRQTKMDEGVGRNHRSDRAKNAGRNQEDGLGGANVREDSLTEAGEVLL